MSCGDGTLLLSYLQWVLRSYPRSLALAFPMAAPLAPGRGCAIGAVRRVVGLGDIWYHLE